MFEDAISELDAMGIPYVENEDGSLSIDISDADKTDVVNIVSFLNNNGLDYTIDDVSIVVMGGEPIAEEPAEDTSAIDMAAMDLEGMM